MIVLDRAEATDRLTQLRLSYDGLIEVVRYADGERALCNASDPRGFDLEVMNARAARGLRQRFCGPDWEFDETDNQAGIRNSALKVRIIHCNFDERTGRNGDDPSNLKRKGSASGLKVACNKTAWLPGLPVPSEASTANFTTYVLGTYYDEATQQVRAELSRPKAFSGGAYRKFDERILLLDGSEGDALRSSRPDDLGPTEIVDIPVVRK